MEKNFLKSLVYSTKEVIDQIKHLDEMNQNMLNVMKYSMTNSVLSIDGNPQRAVEAVLNKGGYPYFYRRF